LSDNGAEISDDGETQKKKPEADLSSLQYKPLEAAKKKKTKFFAGGFLGGIKPNYKNPTEFSIIDMSSQAEYFESK
jgi:hypothetical protein